MSETTSSRLLTLLSLLQGRRDWPGNELADRLEVSARTIRRDVERLRSLGYPVESMTGPAGGYQLRAGTAMPPLLLDDDEAIAIAVALRTAAGGQRAGHRGDRRARAGQARAGAPRAPAPARPGARSARRRRCRSTAGPTVDPQCLTMLAAAVRDHERVRFAYTARDKAGTPPRGRAALARQRRPPLVPRRLGLRAQRLAHVPRRPDRAGRRRPARASRRARSRPVTPPRYVQQCLRSYPSRYEARVTVECPAAELAEPALARRRRTPLGDDRCEVRTERRQPGLAGDADRDDPRALRGRRAARADRAAAPIARADNASGVARAAPGRSDVAGRGTWLDRAASRWAPSP